MLPPPMKIGRNRITNSAESCVKHQLQFLSTHLQLLRILFQKYIVMLITQLFTVRFLKFDPKTGQFSHDTAAIEFLLNQNRIISDIVYNWELQYNGPHISC